jgi:predicted transcriptional regulator
MHMTASGKTRGERRESDSEQSVMDALGSFGALNAGDLASKARGLDKNTCGKPRDRLVERGLVRFRAEGKEKVYELTEEGRTRWQTHLVPSGRKRS